MASYENGFDDDYAHYLSTVDEPRYWRGLKQKGKGFLRGLEFRTYNHSTADGRSLILSEMSTDHIINSIRFIERAYCEEYGINDPSVPFEEILYNNYNNYRCFQKEMAYRRFKVTPGDKTDFPLLKAAIADILVLPPQREANPFKCRRLPDKVVASASGTVTGRFQSRNPNFTQQPKPNQPESTMRHKHLISLLQKGYTTVGVQFAETPNRTYTYKTDIEGLKEGDLAIVKARDVLSIVKIVRVDKTPKIDLDANYEYKWLIQKINLDAYIERVKAEQEVIEQLDAIEQEHQKSVLVEKILEHMPKESPLRKMFDAAVARLNPPKASDLTQVG